MRINVFNTGVLFMAAALTILPSTLVADASTAEQLARLEKRLAELEARLAEAEQDTKEAKVLATTGGGQIGNSSILGNGATFDILANSAWRNLRWTQEEQWAGIRKGISEEKVIELLGPPPRSVKSLKPRIDKVLYYETSLKDRSNTLRGKISFKDGAVVSVSKPNFQVLKSAQ